MSEYSLLIIYNDSAANWQLMLVFLRNLIVLVTQTLSGVVFSCQRLVSDDKQTCYFLVKILMQPSKVVVITQYLKVQPNLLGEKIFR